jgi:hypothetical protein
MNDHVVCGICQEAHHRNDIHMTGCKHPYCMTCFNRLLSGSTTLICPLCREGIETYFFRHKKYRVRTEIIDTDNDITENDITENESRYSIQTFASIGLFVGNIVLCTLYLLESQSLSECQDKNIINVPL